MNKLKYPYRDLLCKYDLGEDIFKVFNIEVKNIVPLRKVFIIISNKGKKILKIINQTEDQINEINSRLEIIEKDCPNVLKYCKSINNRLVETIGDNKYVLLDMNDGREVTFSNPYEVELCTKAVANFHNSSRVLVTDNFINKNNNYIDVLKKDIEYIKEIRSIVNKFIYLNDFDNIFKSTVDYYLEQCYKAIERLDNSNYNKILENKELYVLCHNDLAHHNFIINGEQIFIIDFDYSEISPRINDLAMYISKVVKSTAYNNFSISKKILSIYDEINSLTIDEIEGIKSILTIPKDYIGIVKNYYYKQKSWKEEVFINRFLSKINGEEYRQDFLRWTNKNIIDLKN